MVVAPDHNLFAVLVQDQDFRAVINKLQLVGYQDYELALSLKTFDTLVVDTVGNLGVNC